MKRYLGLLLITLFSVSVSKAQQLTYPLPIDANRAPLYFGVGNSYAFQLTPTTSAYSTMVRYQLPTAGDDINRVYRHLSVINPSTTRTLYICFGNASGCTVDAIIVPPEYQLVYEPLRYGNPVGFGYIYAKLDAGGSVTATFAAW
jgi:hypothetical protein